MHRTPHWRQSLQWCCRTLYKSILPEFLRWELNFTLREIRMRRARQNHYMVSLQNFHLRNSLGKCFHRWISPRKYSSWYHHVHILLPPRCGALFPLQLFIVNNGLCIFLTGRKDTVMAITHFFWHKLHSRPAHISLGKVGQTPQWRLDQNVSAC